MMVAARGDWSIRQQLTPGLRRGEAVSRDLPDPERQWSIYKACLTRAGPAKWTDRAGATRETAVSSILASYTVADHRIGLGRKIPHEPGKIGVDKRCNFGRRHPAALTPS